MAEETRTFTLVLPAGLARRIEQALQADQTILEQIVTRWWLGRRMGRGARALIPADYFMEKETRTIAFTAPTELAKELELYLQANHITLERIVINWLLARSPGRLEAEC